MPRCAPLRSRGDLLLVEIDVGDLPGGVDAGIGAAGDDEPGLAAEDARERALERALHGAQPGLQRPPAKVRAVVGDVEPDAHRPSLRAVARPANPSVQTSLRLRLLHQPRLGQLGDERLDLAGDLGRGIHPRRLGRARGQLRQRHRLLEPLPDERGRAGERRGLSELLDRRRG